MQIKTLILSLFFTFSLLDGCANAQVVGNIYKTAILVPDTGEPTRIEAAGKSLSQILVRASGKMEVLREQNVKSYLDNALNYVEQYRYERTQNKIRLENNRQVWAQKLYLTFSESGVENILNDLGYNLWSKDRPKVLLWVLVKENNNNYILSENSNSLAKNLNYALWSRAVPNYFPKFNSTDAKYMNATKVWQLDIQSAKKAGDFYNAKVNVMGRVYKKGEKWLGDWIVGTDFNNVNFSLTNFDANALIKLASNKIVDILAMQYADKKSQYLSQTKITVHGINNLTAYAELMDYFKKNNNISYIQLTETKNSTLKFKLNLTTKANKFFYALKNSARFKHNGANEFTWN